ncbi:MAG: hypothetical protein JST60_11715 [Chloroflexi bacterium SZAS-1]|nr:hypothetical protein [Chloroflexi bacterium SZAS-1]HNP88805.1 hypothetical protein [Kouleothrix sp.]
MMPQVQRTYWPRMGHQLRATLRRWLRPSALLLVVLGFALAEPLACIIHCQIYTPWLLRNQHQHQHSHAAHIHDAAAPGDTASILSIGQPTMGAAFVPTASEGLNIPWCFSGLTPANPAPSYFVPPSPVHEIVLIVAFALPLFTLISRLVARPPPLNASYIAIPPTPPPRSALLPA